ncbi:MAG: transaldolase [Betaproteobacteria bacterium]|nr:transaldolase [Betaproteobacteria bacterium]
MQTAAIGTTNPLKALAGLGQSVWLDYIRRSLITSGELKRLLDDDGLRGVTSNPAIFEKAITGSTDYADVLDSLRGQNFDAKSAYEQLAISDIRDAADVMRPLYDASHRRDGCVSLEVSPYLARDTQGTLAEARRLWRAVARDNVMIKVPATPEGIPAFEQLIAEGINVNVTLLFSQSAYERVAQAYLIGMKRFAAAGGELDRVASVASFFVSRIDTAIDALISARLKSAADSPQADLLRSVLGKVAIANAKLAYQRYRELFGGARWAALAAKGAQTQRVLWASTGAKNPSYRDVVYVEELIGPDTVNTIPPATFDAFRDHGRVRPSLTEGVESARDTMSRLAQVGISMERVTDKLLDEGLLLFSEAFDKLLSAVDSHCRSPSPARVNR